MRKELESRESEAAATLLAKQQAQQKIDLDFQVQQEKQAAELKSHQQKALQDKQKLEEAERLKTI